MGSVPRPLVALLIGTVAFFALWMLALKPSSSSKSSPHGLGQYQSAINAARQAVATSNGASVAKGQIPGTTASTPAPAVSSTTSTSRVAATPSSTVARKTSATAQSAQAARAAASRLDAVSSALGANKVLALLFYNPTAADDQAVRHELGSVPVHSGRVVKLAVPLGELSRYTVVTNQVPVNQ